MNKQEIAAMVAEILATMGHEPTVKASDYHATTPGPEKPDAHYCNGDFVPDVTQLDLRKLYLTENPANKEEYARLKAKTPARLGSGAPDPCGKGHRTAAQRRYPHRSRL